jgi:hypothetical protein
MFVELPGICNTMPSQKQYDRILFWLNFTTQNKNLSGTPGGWQPLESSREDDVRRDIKDWD